MIIGGVPSKNKNKSAKTILYDEAIKDEGRRKME
jgi:hypothetical protein